MKEKRDSYRFGWVDWLILLLIAVAVFAGVYYWVTNRAGEQESRLITYTLCITVDSSLAWENAIAQNAVVMNQNGTMDLGRVVSVQSRPHLQASVFDRKICFVEIPDRLELLVSVQASAVWQAGDGFRIRDIRMAAGKTGDFRIGGLFLANASVISVE